MSGPVERAPMNRALLEWFAANGRELDVRSTSDPWPTLVAEVMSQQTQIGRIGIPWRAFLDRWPTPVALADAGTDELLRAWAGLGYNRRVLMLREAARRIVAEHDGCVPADVESLDRLPGIGSYTARAVAAAAFGVPVAPLDVNVRRVIARVTGTTGGESSLQAAADSLIAPDQPRLWVHAVMDLAVAVCTRRQPACASCPIASSCASAGTEGEQPVTRSGPAKYEHTRRWLRGRIVARLRELSVGTWLDFDAPIGTHAVGEVRAALDSLAVDGFVETSGTQARLR